MQILCQRDSHLDWYGQPTGAIGLVFPESEPGHTRRRPSVQTWRSEPTLGSGPSTTTRVLLLPDRAERGERREGAKAGSQAAVRPRPPPPGPRTTAALHLRQGPPLRPQQTKASPRRCRPCNGQKRQILSANYPKRTATRKFGHAWASGAAAGRAAGPARPGNLGLGRVGRLRGWYAGPCWDWGPGPGSRTRCVSPLAGSKVPPLVKEAAQPGPFPGPGPPRPLQGPESDQPRVAPEHRLSTARCAGSPPACGTKRSHSRKGSGGRAARAPGLEPNLTGLPGFVRAGWKDWRTPAHLTDARRARKLWSAPAPLAPPSSPSVPIHSWGVGVRRLPAPGSPCSDFHRAAVVEAQV